MKKVLLSLALFVGLGVSFSFGQSIATLNGSMPTDTTTLNSSTINNYRQTCLNQPGNNDNIQKAIYLNSTINPNFYYGYRNTVATRVKAILNNTTMLIYNPGTFSNNGQFTFLSNLNPNLNSPNTYTVAVTALQNTVQATANNVGRTNVAGMYVLFGKYKTYAAAGSNSSNTYGYRPTYTQTNATILHKNLSDPGLYTELYSCVRYYVAKCGDGVRDYPGVQINGLIVEGNPNEQCDGSDGVTPGYSCNSSCQLVQNQQLADLSVTKTVNNSTPIVGSNVTFTMVLNNAGLYAAGNVTLTDILPSGYTYVSHTTTQGTYTPSNGIWNVGNINVNQNLTLTITAQVQSAGTYINTIEVTSSDKPDPDSTPNNHIASEDDQASATVNPLSPAPTCTLTVNPTSIVSGGLASVSWNINGSFLSPTYIYVNPQVPGAFPHLVNTPTGTTYASPTTPGTYTFTMTVVNPISGLSGVCTATLNVGQSSPILTIQKTLLENKSYFSGDQVGFKITFQNIGQGIANQVVLTDILPSSLTYLSSSIYGVSANLSMGMSGANSVITYNGFNLPAGASGYMIITGVLLSNNAGNNTINYTDIYASNHPIVSATAQFTVGVVPSNEVVFTKIGNKSDYQLGENITFTVSTTNNGPAPINDLTITDIRPNSSCITYNSRSSNDGFTNPSNMNRFRSGVLNVGETVTLTLNGTISTNSSCALGYINTANLTYYLYGSLQNKTANYPFNVLAQSQCESLTSDYGTVILLEDDEARAKFTCETVNGVQGNIKIDCGNGQQLNGFGSSFTDYCEYDDADTYTVTCYVENTTSEQCEETIIVDNGFLGYCGNGIREGYEDCDLGGTSSQRNNGIEIEDDLDLDGLDADEYANRGYSCRNCAIIGGDYEPVMCFNINTTLSVQKGEVLPFRWNLEGDNIVDENDCEDADPGDILEDSLRCTFKIYNGHGNEEADDDEAYRITKDCNVDERDGNQMFDYFEDLADQIYFSLDNAFGKYYFRVNDFVKNDVYGEYKLMLEKVEYEYCNGNDEEEGTVIDRVCHVNFTATKPYLMQKSLFGATPKATTDINLDDFYDIEGTKLIKKTDLESIMDVDAKDYDGGSALNTLVSSFVNKYDKLSTKLNDFGFSNLTQGTITELKKVPSKQIYIIKGNGTLTIKQLNSYFNKPFTLVVKGMDLVVEGSVNTNGMFIVQGGKISFKEDPNSRCEATQVVRGIFITDTGFGVGDITLNMSNDLDKPRCQRGGLDVKGVLIGDNIEDLVVQRRSQLNDWFYVNSNNESKIKIERRNEIFAGASVLIEYSPSLRGNLPPGAEDFTKTLEVYKR
ncbi:DUF11 domain-containing protein [Candidatus Gracilibacteria bacterium]|nr:DUF11 domain-containing protein [Candidatus Gracilibacteria bacterium]